MQIYVLFVLLLWLIIVIFDLGKKHEITKEKKKERDIKIYLKKGKVVKA